MSPPLPGVLPAPQPEIAPPAALPQGPPPVPVPQGPPVRLDAVRVEGVTVYPPGSIAPLYADLIGATVPERNWTRSSKPCRPISHGRLHPDRRSRGASNRERTQLFVLRAIEG